MKKEYLLTGAEMATCDHRTSEVIGIPSLVLMERAALSVAEGVDACLQRQGLYGRHGDRPVVLAAAGRGNNGADALAAGRILLDRGYDVRFLRLSGKVSPESSFAVQEHILQSYGAEVEEFPQSSFPETLFPDVIIDGLFGTGLSRDLQGEAAQCVEAINCCRKVHGSYVVAVDIPSGISSDDGRVMGCAVECDETRTFAFYKRGHVMYPGAVYAGSLHLAQIGITERAFEKQPGMFTLTEARAADLMPARNPGGNKGTFGKVLIAAGRQNMCGAAILAARACMAAGAGMVKIYTHEANRVIIQQTLPEALLDTFTDQDTPQEAAQRLRASLDWADIAAAGPAMGTDEIASSLLREILQYVQKEEEAVSPGNADSGSPVKERSRRSVRGLVLDADAIRLLAKDSRLRDLLASRRREIPCILTPHMAEFAALAGCSVGEVIGDRTRLVQEQADLLAAVIACKDARTLVAEPSMQTDAPVQYLNCTGNSGMSAAGSGDVLTGITAAFLALDFTQKESIPSSCGYVCDGGSEKLFSDVQCRSGFAAAVSAVCMHGRAGDLAKEAHGEEGMTAGDLAQQLRLASFWK